MFNKSVVIARSRKATKQSFKRLLRPNGLAMIDALSLFCFQGLVFCIFLTGCAKLQHLPQLLTLKAMDEEGTGMAQEIERHDKKFEELIALYKANKLYDYPTKKSVRKHFGEPIQEKEVLQGDAIVDRWLYRRSVEKEGAEKLYLFFTKDGKLMSFDYVPASH